MQPGSQGMIDQLACHAIDICGRRGETSVNALNNFGHLIDVLPAWKCLLVRLAFSIRYPFPGCVLLDDGVLSAIGVRTSDEMDHVLVLSLDKSSQCEDSNCEALYHRNHRES